MQPFVKWVGGKTRAMPQIEKVLAPFLRARPHARYVVPFNGAGGDFFWLEERGLLQERVVWLNDLCFPLMVLWKALQGEHASETIRQVQNLIAREVLLGEEADSVARLLKPKHKWKAGRKIFYPQARDEINLEHSDTARTAALFYYLNRAGYNGQWRENQDGKMNVPAGNSPMPVDAVHSLTNAASLLQSMPLLHLTCLPYISLMPALTAGDIVYFDPPYHGSKIFKGYVRGGIDWRLEGQRTLRSACDALVARGITVVTSNSLEALPIWSDWDHKLLKVSRTVSCQAATRGDATEILAWRDGYAR